MRNLAKMLVLEGMCIWILVSGCQAHNTRELQKIDRSGVIVKYGASRITTTMIELRCEIVNNMGEDIWIIDGSPNAADPNAANQMNARAFVDKDDRTLVIAERIGRLDRVEVWAHVGARYRRLRAGQSRPGVLLTYLPITLYTSDDGGFSEVSDRGVDHLTRLAFEIGYFTDKDLTLLKPNLRPFQRIWSDESGDQVTVSDSTQGELCRTERALRITIDGIHLPYKEWLKAHRRLGPSI